MEDNFCYIMFPSEDNETFRKRVCCQRNNFAPFRKNVYFEELITFAREAKQNDNERVASYESISGPEVIKLFSCSTQLSIKI